MRHLESTIEDHIAILTLSRVDKSNAFDDTLLKDLQIALEAAIHNPEVRVILLKAKGKHFSAGADVGWMQRMVHLSEAENLTDALLLAKVMHTLHTSPKPTIAMVHGSAFGGGAGLVAAADIAIAGTSACFCFSEVKLGLIPAVISPYVVKSIGARNAKAYFMSAKPFDAARALSLTLVHHCEPDETLLSYTMQYAKHITTLAPNAIKESKKLVDAVAGKPIDQKLINETAALIAKIRVSDEGQKGLQAFLNQQTPQWD